MEIVARAGGWVFPLLHNVQADVTPDRICRACDTALKQGRYSLAVC